MKRSASNPWKGPDRIKADLAKQAPNNSYSPNLHYESVKFSCRDCGKDCVWTAEQQRLFYEEWGGSIYATAVRCRECRTHVRREKIEKRSTAKPSQPKSPEKRRIRNASTKHTTP